MKTPQQIAAIAEELHHASARAISNDVSRGGVGYSLSIGQCEEILTSHLADEEKHSTPDKSLDDKKPVPLRNAIAAYELLEKVKQLLHSTTEIADNGCRLAATVIINLERGTLKDDEHGSLRKLANNVIQQSI